MFTSCSSSSESKSDSDLGSGIYYGCPQCILRKAVESIPYHIVILELMLDQVKTVEDVLYSDMELTCSVTILFSYQLSGLQTQLDFGQLSDPVDPAGLPADIESFLDLSNLRASQFLLVGSCRVFNARAPVKVSDDGDSIRETEMTEKGLEGRLRRTWWDIQQLLSEEFIQQYLVSDFEGISQPQLGDLEIMASERDQLCSFSSLLRSLSVGSPDTSPRLLAQQSPPFILQSFNFVAPRTEEDEAMERALLALNISFPLILNQQHIGIQMGAFRPYYNNPFTPEEYLKPNRLHGQRMIKKGLHMLRRISMMKLQLEAARAQEYQQPMSNQSQHVISERKRRQKFNDHFNALKMLLPPELMIKKKDKLTVLLNVTNYLNLLKDQIKELEERNSALEMQVQVPKEDQVDMSIGYSNERVKVQVNRASESTSETQQIDLRVVVKEDCDMIDWFIRVLECLKEMRGMMLISMETRKVSSENNRFGIASFRLQVQVKQALTLVLLLSKLVVAQEENPVKSIRQNLQATVALLLKLELEQIEARS
ncbi:putative transcription factor bHLH041 [Zingiber officinale]|uniref:putative transcription factor bHLH041 n=1 Tax=Zingiber officinale TaxID=94328 RepID=UPI001C4CC675|nr:putative transcription factor bHLH041 [Zingiber officinale]